MNEEKTRNVEPGSLRGIHNAIRGVQKAIEQNTEALVAFVEAHGVAQEPSHISGNKAPVDLRVDDDGALPHQKLHAVLQDICRTNPCDWDEPVHFVCGGVEYLTSLSLGEMLAVVRRLKAVE
jgi:hypothetical protein